MFTAEVSYHIRNERMDRMMFIAQNIGWGTEVFSLINYERGVKDVITTTGILMVISIYDGKLITAYPPSISKLYAICKSCGYNHIPRNLNTKVERNQALLKKNNIK